VLFISHDLRSVAFLCERVAVLYLGQLMEIGPRATVIEEPRHPYTQALIASIPSLIPGEGITRELIHGEISDQAPPPGGCVFAPRCALRERLGNPEICLTTRPTLQSLAEDHGAACHFAERADGINSTSLHNTGSLRP
jgi:oligopeptide/dipeptide ABC transporter ATP-binding protein